MSNEHHVNVYYYYCMFTLATGPELQVQIILKNCIFLIDPKKDKTSDSTKHWHTQILRMDNGNFHVKCVTKKCLHFSSIFPLKKNKWKTRIKYYLLKASRVRACVWMYVCLSSQVGNDDMALYAYTIYRCQVTTYCQRTTTTAVLMNLFFRLSTYIVDRIVDKIKFEIGRTQSHCKLYNVVCGINCIVLFGKQSGVDQSNESEWDEDRKQSKSQTVEKYMCGVFGQLLSSHFNEPTCSSQNALLPVQTELHNLYEFYHTKNR